MLVFVEVDQFYPHNLHTVYSANTNVIVQDYLIKSFMKLYSTLL